MLTDIYTFLSSPHFIPIAAIIGYINYPSHLRINEKVLYIASIIHNVGLVAFSGYTCFALGKILYEKGIVFQTNYYFQDPTFDNLIFYFYLSKYYEFLDTFLIYLKGKKPIFLQKYHHIGALISWHLFYYYKLDAVWTATIINSFVHTIMYFYYLGTILKINQVKIIKKYITTLQLCQFFTLYLNFYFYMPSNETLFNYKIIYIIALYGTGLIILFGNFYYKEYIRKNSETIQIKDI